MTSIHFARPIALLLLVCLVPIAFWARRSMGGLSRARWAVALGLRLAICLLVVLALAQLQWWFVRDEILNSLFVSDGCQSSLWLKDGGSPLHRSNSLF